MGKYYVGLDVHSEQSTFVIEDAAGTVIAQGEVPTTRPALERLCAAHHLPAGLFGAPHGAAWLGRCRRHRPRFLDCVPALGPADMHPSARRP